MSVPLDELFKITDDAESVARAVADHLESITGPGSVRSAHYEAAYRIRNKLRSLEAEVLTLQRKLLQ